jgi:hypothetical protein
MTTTIGWLRLARPGALVLAISIGSAGCLVVGVGRFYDDDSIVADERILGAWKSGDDNVSLVIERSEWRSYRVQYVHPTESGSLTAYLFRRGDVLYTDLTLVRGKDFGVFAIPGHALARVEIGADTLTVTPLSYDALQRRQASGTLPASLAVSRGERDQVVLGADRLMFWSWLATQPAAEIFGAATVFRRPSPGYWPRALRVIFTTAPMR